VTIWALKNDLPANPVVWWAWQIHRDGDAILDYELRAALHRETCRRTAVLGKGCSAVGLLLLAVAAVGAWISRLRCRGGNEDLDEASVSIL